MPADELRTIGLAMASAIEDDTGANGVDVLADIVSVLMGTKRPDDIADDDIDLPTDEASLDVAAAVFGRWVVETVRTAAAERLEHVDGQFDDQIRRLAPPVVEEIVARRRDEHDRATRGLDVLQRAAHAGCREGEELATAR